MKLLALVSFFFTASVFAIGLSDYEVSEIEVTPLGSGTHVKVGRFSEFGKFRLSNRHDKKLLVQSLTLKNYGKANLSLALKNAGIYVNNELISTGFSTQGRYINFFFFHDLKKGYPLPAGDSVIFSIRATLSYARTGHSIELGLQYPEDFKGVEANTGLQAVLKNRFRLAKYTLHSGDLNVIRQYYKWRRYNFRR